MQLIKQRAFLRDERRRLRISDAELQEKTKALATVTAVILIHTCQFLSELYLDETNRLVTAESGCSRGSYTD
jgi:hypothetical protein